jgi:hypothetical protein
VKRLDRPRVRVIPETFRGGTLPCKELKVAKNELGPNETGLIVAGEPTLAKGFDKAVTKADEVVKSSVDATADELAVELREAVNS